VARLLVVDNDADLLAVIGVILRRAGHEVTSTNSGGDALCLLADSPHDLMLLDMRMPGRDGNGVLADLPPNAPPVVVMTGDATVTAEFLGSKVKRVLFKPFDVDKLLGVVNGVLAGYADGAAVPPGDCP
jgi:DNA-binding NtrC family response regulator